MTNKIKEQILYVDDEIENLDGFKFAFMQDFDISVAKNAKEGLEILKQKNIKVVISDQKMPEISGVEFLNIVKEKYPDTVRIILTAYADITNAIEAINKGEIFRYLSKPWEKTDLKSTIQNALESYNLKLQNRNLIENLRKTNQELSIANNKLKETIITIEENEEHLQKQNEEYAALNEEYKTTNEKLIITKEKVEESDRLKTEFINNMSHEIRTPMNGILGFTQFLEEPNITKEKQKQYINIIKNSGNQLLRIIDDILEISKLETKQVKVIETEVCLNEILLELFSIFDIKAKEKKIPLYFKKNLSDLESTINTDKTKLNKILSNLLENALKFTNNGFIEFGYNLIQNNIDKSQQTLEIYVKDTGIGIATDKQEIIFERFSQEEKNLSNNVGGLGLGLSIAKENSELIGGKIRLESEKGKGANFYVSIPYKPIYIEPENNIPSYISINKSDSKYQILIVEDEEINYLYLETLIKNKIKLDCNILHAKDGKEAVNICKNKKNIQLVLMDLKMPIMNGYEATKLIKEFRPQLPIIAQTAYSTNIEKGKAVLFGCDDFISKPISEDTLSAILNKYLITILR